jgi:hypothetical protein
MSAITEVARENESEVGHWEPWVFRAVVTAWAVAAAGALAAESHHVLVDDVALGNEVEFDCHARPVSKGPPSPPADDVVAF